MGRFSTKKTELEALSEDFALKYGGKDVWTFIMKADKLYQKAKLGEQAKFALIREALKADQMILTFALFRGASTYEDVKEECLEYADNQKMQSPSRGKVMFKEDLFDDSSKRIDDLSAQIESLALIIGKKWKAEN